MLPFRDEDLNYFKFVTLVVNEFPKALRQTFKTIWDNSHGHRPGFQLWDDSTAVRNLFASTEGGSRTKVPVHQSFLEWDCTALFQATIYSRTFARHGTLNDVYVKPRGISHGHFHMSVVSTTGNHMETTALAIDQLRLLRNSVCHSTSSEMKRVTFDQYVKHAKGAFQALGVSTDRIDAVDSLSESDFPTNEVSRLKHAIDEERRSYIAFLESVNSNFDELAKNTADKEDVAMLSKKMNEVIRKVSGSRENLSDLSARKEGKLKNVSEYSTPLKISLKRSVHSLLTWVKMLAKSHKRSFDYITSYTLTTTVLVFLYYHSPRYFYSIPARENNR